MCRRGASTKSCTESAVSVPTPPCGSRALGLRDMFFINMQAHFYAEIAREQLATELATIQRIA